MLWRFARLRVCVIVMGAIWWASPAASVEGGSAAENGFRYRPSLGWSRGDHRVDLHVDFRARWEIWKARATSWGDFWGLRSSVGVRYAWKDRVAVLGEMQITNVLGLSENASGAGRVYRNFSSGGDSSSAESVRVSQLYLDLKPTEDSLVRLGRQRINLGTLMSYSKPGWSYVKKGRLAMRLVGTVGWTHGERSYDGISGRLDLGSNVVYAFAAEPTTGVFEIENAYERQKKVIFGGVDWTVKAGALLDDTEFSGFFIGYSDSRDPAQVAGLFGDIEVFTLGASMLGVYEFGPGRIDALLWGAYQFGDFVDTTTMGIRNLSQSAGAVLAELGYQLDGIPTKPWLRVGVNWASGDADPSDGDRNTFFNLLPTNHPYYGYADQLAFSNLIDLFVQLKLSLVKDLGLELFLHRFWLSGESDFRYSGTGAFARNNFGYGRGISNGSNDVGIEVDVVARYAFNSHASMQIGYAFLDGGRVFDNVGANRNTGWGFAQVHLKY